MPFLSLLDDRAKPKGSRDPLGFEVVWSYFGRKVVGNLTTITSSMDNFAVALLGFYWANQAAQFETDEAIKLKRIREEFLCYEQLIGYLRYHGDAEDIMGITRIKQRMEDSSFRITLGQSSEQRILSDQATYGLWGLYSSAARVSGLITGNDRVLTPKGAQIVDSIIEQLGDAANKIKALLLSDKPFRKDRFDHLADRFMQAIHHKRVQQPLLEALMVGNEPQGPQAELWAITREIFRQKEGQPEALADFIQQVLANKPSERLAASLQDILMVERFLVAVNNLFHYCRRMDGEPLDEILQKLDGRYHYDYLPTTLPADNFPRRDQLVTILDALRSNDMAFVVNETFRLNKEVMQQRGGAPWVELESGATCRVKVKSETAELKKQSELEHNWDYDYFLGSFFYIARQQLSRT